MYLALYRKWRPKSFDDVVGQEHITTTLKNEVINNKTVHSYLFTGSRGTGKTSCSKILAMAVNCPNTVDGNPCMECPTCKGIEDGSILDVLEIDAASNNGVDDVRILREEANYSPTQCKYRVYIIDETHMLSPAAFNALLKIMEEPPPHVKFILATTEVHKVPATILSRCQRFDFARISTEDIAKRLLYIADHEEFTLTEDGAFFIARLADGAMRDALSILDQCIAYSSEVNMDVITMTTGLVLRDYLFSIADVVTSSDVSEAIRCVDELYAKSKDLQKLTVELIEHFRNLMLVKTVKNPADLIKALPDEITRLGKQASSLSIDDILRSIDILQDCLDKMGKNYDKRLCLEMALIKLCSADTNVAVGSKAQSSKPAAKPQKPVLADTPASTPAQDKQNKETSDENAAKPQEPKKVAKPNLKPTEFELWPEVLADVKEIDPALAGILSGSLAYCANDVLFIDSPVKMFSSMIKKEGFIKNLLTVLEQKTGIRYTIKIKKSSASTNDKQKNVLDELQKAASDMGVEVSEI